MMYPFLQLDDQTEIVHSDMRADGKVKVYIEKPVINAARCFSAIDQEYCSRYAAGVTPLCFLNIRMK